MLRCGRWGVTVGQEFAGTQWILKALVNVQGVYQSRAFLHNPDAGMFVSMNAAFVTLRQTKPAFQVEIVARLIRIVAADEQPLMKAVHDPAHVLPDRIIAGP